MEYGASDGGLVALTTPAATSHPLGGWRWPLHERAPLNSTEHESAHRASPCSAGEPDLHHALQQLTAERQQRLAALVDETRRCDELISALADDAGQALRQQRAELGRAIIELLMGWQALGGRVELTAPQPPAPVHQGEAVEDPGAQSDAASEPTATPAQEPPTPPRRPVQPRLPQRPATPEPPASDWDEDLADLLDGISSTTNAQEEMDAIQRAASASFGRWPQYPRSVQRALVGNLACRLRHLQDHLGVTGAKLDSAFRSLTRFSKSFQPGWVNGLTRGRGPAADSWAEEGRVWWDQLALSAKRHDDDPLPDTGVASLGRDESLDCVRNWLSEWREAPDVAKPMCLEKTLTAIQAALDSGVPHHDPALCRLADEIYDHLELSRFRRLRQGIRDLELAEREDQGL